MPDTTPSRPAMTMREIRDRLGHTRPDTTPTDRRVRYAAAIRALNEGGGTLADLDETSDVLTLADAVMAVADAEQAALRAKYREGLRRADTINNQLMAEVQRYADGSERPVLWSVYNEMHLRADRAEAEVERLRADRATVLREAADVLGRLDFDQDARDYGYDTYRDAWDGGVMDGAGVLRRLADEAQQTETEDDDPICGNQYDDEVCELEPEHPGAHCAGTVCWDYEPAPAPTEEPRQRPTPFECEPGNRCHACAVCWS
ncbi:hypothetical protein [Streptomyces sp. NPDC088115]|uniref:hypothetical protein n=1 Tax=Streptomyces sp. NPDC088115 TaxID=3365824 RepID=UPI0038153786